MSICFPYLEMPQGTAACSEVIHQDQASRSADVATSKNQPDEKMPLLKNAETRRVWVPAKIEGKKYVHGHYVDIIEHESEWGSSDE